MIKSVKLEKSLKMVVRWVVLHCAQGFCLVLGAMGAGASCMLFLHHPKPSFFQLNIFNSKINCVKKVCFRFGGWRWYCLKTLERKRPAIRSATTPLWITVQLSNPSIHHLIVSLPKKIIAVIKGKVGHIKILFCSIWIRFFCMRYNHCVCKMRTISI